MTRARPPSTAAGDVILPIIGVVAELGVDPETLCRKVGIDRVELARDGMRVGEEIVIRLWDVLEDETGDAMIGLHVAERLCAGGRWGLFEYALKTCPNLGAAIARIRRHLPLLFTGSDELVDRVDENGAVTFGYRRLPGGNPLVPLSEDCVIASFVLTCRAAVGPSFRPARVYFQRPAPSDDAEYRRILGGPISFAALFNGVELEEAVLQAPIATHDPTLLRLLDEVAERRLAALGDDRSMARLVEDWVERRLDVRGPVSIDDAAHALHVSVRSLQRSLESEATTYRDVLDNVRRRIALRRIRVVSAKEVANELGFSDKTQFYRAFRRWTGLSVPEYRHGARIEDDPHDV